MPIDIRARLVSAPRHAGYSASLLATQANYYGDTLADRGADAECLTRSALEYEALGYDSALIPQRSGWPDVWALTAWALATTTRFAIAAAHRVGLQNPTAAARPLPPSTSYRAAGSAPTSSSGRPTPISNATVTSWTRRRATGGRPSTSMSCACGWRARPLSTSAESSIGSKTLSPAHRPAEGSVVLSYGGSSDESLELAGQYADVYAVTAESLAGTAELYGGVCGEIAEGKRSGRSVSGSVARTSFLGETDAAARRKADEITTELLVARDYQERKAISLAHGINEQPESVNRQRFLSNVYDERDWHDKAMYTASVVSLATVGLRLSAPRDGRRCASGLLRPRGAGLRDRDERRRQGRPRSGSGSFQAPPGRSRRARSCGEEVGRSVRHLPHPRGICHSVRHLPLREGILVDSTLATGRSP